MQDSENHNEPPDLLPLEDVLKSYERPRHSNEVCNRVRNRVIQEWRPQPRVTRRRRRAMILAAAAVVALATLFPGIRTARSPHAGKTLSEVARWSNFEALAGLDRDIARIDGSISKLRRHGFWGNRPFEHIPPMENSQ